MYSYEERMRAVELYIKLGKRLRATIREIVRRTGLSRNTIIKGCVAKSKADSGGLGGGHNYAARCKDLES